MKLISFQYRGIEMFGFVKDNDVINLKTALNNKYSSLQDFIENGNLKEVVNLKEENNTLPLTEVKFLPVITSPQQIFCIGLNYLDHVQETKNEVKPYPTIFIRLASSQCGHLSPIIKPEISEKLDYEGEMAIVIGRYGKNIAASDAESYIYGYSCYNDVSVRDWQHHTGQWAPGKNFEGTGSFGPWLVTSDEIRLSDNLEIKTILNGQVVQQSTTSMLINSIPDLIAYISTFAPLYPGDVIVTGTPGGVGARRTPPLFMKKDDVIEVYIEKIGTLKNVIQ